MKKICCKLQLFAIFVLLVLVFPLGVTAQENISSFDQRIGNSVILFVESSSGYVNGSKTPIDAENMSVFPFIKDDRTLVPVRFISESFGANVGWNDLTSTVTVSLNGKNVSLQIGSKSIIVNGVASQLDVPAQIINDRTFIPLRALSESLGKNVFWDDRGLIIISNSTFSETSDNVLITNLVKEFNKYGNTIGNIINRGIVAKDTEWIYYLDIANDSINKIKNDGTQKTVLLNANASNLNVLDGWIYFLERNNIYKATTLGNGKIKVCNSYVYSFVVIGDWIYYMNGDYYAYKIKINGTCNSNLKDNSSTAYRINNDFLSFVDDNGIQHSVKLNPKVSMYEDNYVFDSNSGDFVYKTNYFDDGIYRMNLNGDYSTKISEANTQNSINVSNNWIYYSNDNDYYTLYKMKVNGTENSKIYDDISMLPNILDDWIYYVNAKVFEIYKVKLDGTNRSSIDGTLNENSILTQADKNEYDAYVKEAEIRVIETNQLIVQRSITTLYITNGYLPTKEEVEDYIYKSLEEMKLKLIYNADGTITIRNTDSDYTLQEVPDVIFELPY